MRKKIGTVLLNTAIVLLVFCVAGALANLIFIKFWTEAPAEETINWTCGNYAKSLIRGFQPNCNGRWTKKSGSRSFDVEFSTDAFGRRIVFEKAKKSTSDAGQVLFFGGSDVLGQAINDRDTIANQFFNLSDFAHVRNYGGPGFGPQQTLEYLQFGNLVKEAPPDPDRNVMVFFFGDNHVQRAGGAWAVATSWGAFFPYYALDADDQLVFKGNFTSGGRYSRLQLLAKKVRLFDDLISRASDHFNYSDANLRLTAKILAAAKAEFFAKYKNAQFYVVFSPITFRSSPKLKKLLNEFNIDYFDYSKVWDPENPANVLPEGHPSPLVYHLVAEQLAKDLKK